MSAELDHLYRRHVSFAGDVSWSEKPSPDLTPEESAAVQAVIAREDKAARAHFGLTEEQIKARCIEAATRYIMTLEVKP